MLKENYFLKIKYKITKKINNLFAIRNNAQNLIWNFLLLHLNKNSIQELEFYELILKRDLEFKYSTRPGTETDKYL